MAYQYRGTKWDAGTPIPEEPRAPSTPGPKPKARVFNPENCGTMAGYWHHRATNTPKCQPCLDANAEYNRDYDARVKSGAIFRGFRPDACGTRAGYFRHLRHDVPVCDPCALANAEYMDAYKAERKAARKAAKEAAHDTRRATVNTQ